MSEQTMVERVALAYRAAVYGPSDDPVTPREAAAARAAIKAMREPTPAMVEAGEAFTDNYYSEDDDFADGWRAAIDASLSESGKEG